MTIAVTTPTGHVGSRVVRLLIQAGTRPRLLVRDPARLDPATRDHADVRRGDLTDALFVQEATAGGTSLFVVDPTSHTAEAPVEESTRFGEIIADAVRYGGISRVVFLSSVGAEKRHGVGHIDGLGRIEECLNATDADVLHLRCGYFFTNLLLDLDGLRRGELTTAADPHAPMPWVDPRDIGDLAAARLLSEFWHGQVVHGVHGPQDLTYSQVAEILTDVLKRPIRLAVVDDDHVRRTLRDAGLPPGAVEGIVGMTAGTRGLEPEPPRDLTSTTPTTLAAWAYANLRPTLALQPSPAG